MHAVERILDAAADRTARIVDENIDAAVFGADLPDGFDYRDGFISEAEESTLAGEISRIAFAHFEMRGVVARRRVAFFGASYADAPAEPIPAFLVPIRARLAAMAEVDETRFVMALINEYRAGAPIGWHRDAPQYDIVAGLSLGHFTGHLLELTGVAMLIVFAVAAAVAALQIGIGILGSLVAMIVFIWLGSQGSSGASAWELLPWFTRAIGPYLPAGAGVDAVRAIVYFDGAGVGKDLLILAGYAVAGSVVVLLVGRRHGLTLPNEAEVASGTATIGGV